MKVQSVVMSTTALPTFKLPLENNLRSTLSGTANIFERCQRFPFRSKITN
ncbi:hypothetical protein F7734_22425 [Scytonema sp. UIC 10036]|nr:hypothetical protein [Scytonema sp. UIC 10036]MUG94967.1 hypothetical protein [Scytonema sp. UIC 10036]